MPAVTSEAIARIEHDAPSATLFVQFRSGEWYAYAAVPRPVFEAFAAAPSHGRFFQDHVRDHYAHTGPLPVSPGHA